MTNPSLLIIGCGDLGTRLGLQMVNLGWQVFGARRNINQLPKVIQGICLDLYTTELPKDWPQQTLDYVVFCTAPTKQEQDCYHQLYYNGLQQTLNWLKLNQQSPKRLLVVSSTSVYGQSNGQWLNEDSPTKPTGIRGQTMLAMEQLALQSNIASTCIRLAGIYGPHRNRLINQAKQGVHFAPEPPLYANRIHIDDAANLLKHLIIRDSTGKNLDHYYIGVDNDPAPIQATLTWLRSQLGSSELATDYAIRTVGSKRLSNQKARSIGWTPYYTNYKQGYSTLLS